MTAVTSNSVEKTIKNLSKLRARSETLTRLGLRGFPWKTAGRHFGLLFLGYVTVLVITGYSLRYTLTHASVSLENEAEHSAHFVLQLTEHFDQQLAILFAFLTVAGGLWVAITTYWAFRPMGRVLQSMKRRRVGRSREVDTQDPRDLFVDEPGEWAEVERGLDRLVRRLENRELEINRERDELVTILGAVNEAIVAMGTETEPLYFNSRFAVLFGPGTVQGAQQDTPFGASQATLPLKERFRVPELLEGFNRVLTEGRTRSFRVRLRTELHATEREFSVSVSPLLLRETLEFRSQSTANTNYQGMIYGAVAVFHDITELKQMEQIRIDFVANASHELKTPLTSIKGYVETARMDLDEATNVARDPVQQKSKIQAALDSLNVVARNVDRLMALVLDLLDLSKLESGSEVEKTLLDPQEVTESALRLIDPAKLAKHPVYVDCSTSRLIGDARRIEQVLLNLVDNAMKYSPDGSEIRIQWESGPSPSSGVGSGGSETTLRVRDGGPGISDEHLPRLFERFYRVDAGRAREVGGTGLGLAIVKHIVLAHGGSIAVRSKVGSGSEFICRFPNKTN